jgi:hypothetical protein
MLVAEAVLEEVLGVLAELVEELMVKPEAQTPRQQVQILVAAVVEVLRQQILRAQAALAALALSLSVT